MTAGYTQLTYNGISIEHCVTKRFAQEPVFDPSDTDLLYYKFMVRVQGFVHGHTDWQGGVGITGASGLTQDAASYERSMRYRLAENRQEFEMRMGVSANSAGTVILAAKPVPSGASSRIMAGFDLNNGPRCKVIEITHVTGNEIFKIEAEFEVCILECDAEGGVPNGTGVLSNRWSCIDEIDQNFFTTRTYEGLLRTFSNQINPNSFRAYVVPPLQPGLRRERMSFSVTEDGLNLRYSIIDREVAFSAPYPATNWVYRYTETLANEMVSNGELSITLEGDRNVDKKELVKIAAGMINARLLGFGRPVANAADDLQAQSFVEFLSFTDESGSSNVNRITANARVMRKHEQVKREQFVGARMGRPIDADDFNNVVANYDANLSRDGRAGEIPEIEGPIEMAGAFAAYLQRPCSTKHRISETGFTPGVTGISGDEEAAQGGVGPTLSARVVSSEQDLPAEYLSQSHVQAIYTFWKVNTNIRIASGKVALPIARSSRDSLRSSDDSNRDTVAVIGLHSPIATRVVRLSGERVGKFPQLPEARTFKDQNGITHHLMDTNVTPSTVTRTPDGKPYFRVDAEYHFTMSRPPKLNERVEIGENPWDVLGVQSVNINYAEVVGESPTIRTSTGRGALGGEDEPAEAEIPNDQV